MGEAGVVGGVVEGDGGGYASTPQEDAGALGWIVLFELFGGIDAVVVACAKCGIFCTFFSY